MNDQTRPIGPGLSPLEKVLALDDTHFNRTWRNSCILRFAGLFCFLTSWIPFAVILKLKQIVPPAAGILLLTGCLDPAREADFGCKAAAAYGNYDSAVLNITRAAEKPKVREMLREHPAAAAYYLRVLAIAEQYRGNLKESENAFRESKEFQAHPLTSFACARFALTERAYSAREFYLGEVPGFTRVENPQPGDICADGKHVGIVSEKGRTISASKDRVVENDWGFRSNSPVKSHFYCYTGAHGNEK